MLFHNKSGCYASRSSNDIDFVLFPTATSVGSPFTTIYINSMMLLIIYGLRQAEARIDRSSFRV